MNLEEKLKGSFLLFLWYVWTRVLLLPEPTRVQNDIAGFLEGGPRKRFIAAFRGVGKTFLTGAYIVWRLWKDPDLKVMVVSANERFAGKVAMFIHTLINAKDAKSGEDVPWSELKARSGQKNSTLEFDVGPAKPSKDPSVFAVGITGQMTGGRAGLIMSDDIEVPNNSETEAQREKLDERSQEYADILVPGGEVVYLGTFQSMQSIYRGLRDKGYTMRVWPGRYPLKEKMHLYADTLAPMLKKDIEENPSLMTPTGSALGGAPTDPQRFTEMDLIERETEKTAAGFQLQFMLDTSLTDEGRYPLKTRDLIVDDVAIEVAPMRVAWGSSPDLQIKDMPNVGFDGDRLYRPVYKSDEWVPFTGSLMEIDPSGSGADETAYMVSKFLNGTVYVRQWGGFRDGHSETTMRKLAEIAKAEKVNVIRIEDNFGDGMFGRLLEPHLRKVAYPVPVEGHKVSGQKEKRIITLLRPALQAHRVVIHSDVIRNDLALAQQGSDKSGSGATTSSLERSGIYQLTHITDARGALRKDDRIDVFANTMGYWAEFLNADAREAEEAAEKKATKDFEALLWGTSVQGRLNTHRSRKRGRGRRRR